MSFAPGHLARAPAPSGHRRRARAGRLSATRRRGRRRRRPARARTRSCWSRPSRTRRFPDAGTQISLHQPRLKDEAEASAFVQLAAQLGYLRLSGYRLALERAGLRSKVSLVNPATGAIVATIPDKQPGRLFGGGANASEPARRRPRPPTRRPAAGSPEPRAAASGAAGARAPRRVARWRRSGRAGRSRARARRARAAAWIRRRRSRPPSRTAGRSAETGGCPRGRWA